MGLSEPDTQGSPQPNDIDINTIQCNNGSCGDGEAQRLLAAEQAAEALNDDEQDPGPKDWQRFYMGYHQRFVEDCVLELRGGKLRVHLAQAPSAKVAAKRGAEGRNGSGRDPHHKQAQKLDKASDPALTGTTVWDGAVVLAHYLTETSVLVRPPGEPFAYSGGTLPTVLELGAGTGAVSLALAACRCAASVTATDLQDLLPHLRHNLGRNSALLTPGRVHVQPLRWGPEGESDVRSLVPVKPPFDVIVGSDLIYYSYTPETPHSRLLLWTLRRLCGPRSAVYLSLSLHHNPEEVERFLQWAEEGEPGEPGGFGFHVLRLRRSIPEQWRVPDVLVVRLTPKWPAPPAVAAAAADADTAADADVGVDEVAGPGELTGGPGPVSEAAGASESGGTARGRGGAATACLGAARGEPGLG